MIRPARMPLSESANICFNIDFGRHSYFWPPYPICFFRIFHFVVRKLKRDTHFISFACTEI